MFFRSITSFFFSNQNFLTKTHLNRANIIIGGWGAGWLGGEYINLRLGSSVNLLFMIAANYLNGWYFMVF